MKMSSHGISRGVVTFLAASVLTFGMLAPAHAAVREGTKPCSNNETMEVYGNYKGGVDFYARGSWLGHEWSSGWMTSSKVAHSSGGGRWKVTGQALRGG